MIARKFQMALFHRLNRLILWKNGILYPRSTVINGPIHWQIHRNSRFHLSENISLQSALNINPLCPERKASIYLQSNAVLKIGAGTGMSSPTIWCASMIEIGDNCVIGANVTLIDTNVHSLDYRLRRNNKDDERNARKGVIKIGKDVFIGEGCLIMKGTDIGDNAVIGARSIIKSTVEKGELIPPGTVR